MADGTARDPSASAPEPAPPAPTLEARLAAERHRLSPWRRRLGAYLNMVFVDHGFFRFVYLNLHRVGAGSFRSAQPAPHHFKRIAAKGVKTVVNLRGGREFGSYPLELEACARRGLAYEEVRLRSREAPSLETIEAVAEIFERAERPLLVHCKSGADRAGLMSALYLLIVEGADPETAKRALSLRYGHVRASKTGVLDAFIEAYARDRAAAAAAGRDLPFLVWARTLYDKRAVTDAFRARGWADFLVDRVLARE